MILLYLAIAYLVGIALGQYLWAGNPFGCQFPLALWVLPFGLLPLLPLLQRFPLFQRRATAPMRWPATAGFEPPTVGPSPLLLIAIFFCLLMGVLRAGSQPLHPCWTPADLAYYNLPANRAFDRAAPEVTITGYINSYPLVTDTKQQLQLVATSLLVDSTEQPVRGTVRLTTGLRQRYAYGQPVRVQGRLVTPPEFTDFSYRDYLARKGIYSLLYNAQLEPLAAPLAGSPLLRTLYGVRARGEALLNRLLPEPYAALANGMLLGIDAGIPDQLYDQFNLTGVSHTIVISGSNISILSGLLLAIGQTLWGRRRALWPTLLGIAGYALLVGGDAAVLRAALMGSLFVTATALGRRSTALVSLGAACWALTLVNPLTLWDVGFQLSSAATAGLILFTPGLTAFVAQHWPARQAAPSATAHPHSMTRQLQRAGYRLLQDGLLVTIAANLTTLPLVLYYFGRLSIVGFLTNVLVAPVQPLIMLWGTLGVLLGVIGLTWVAWLVLLAPWVSLVWTVAIVQWTAVLPGGSMEMADYHLGHLLLTYGLIALGYGAGRLRSRVRTGFNWLCTNGAARLLNWSAVGALGIAAIVLWAAVLTQPDGRLHLYFLDIGQGDGILIQTPSGRQILIDGGASPQQLFSQLGAVMPFWARRLDLVVLTNPDKDHMDAQAQTPVRFQVVTALETKASTSNPDADLWRANMTAAGVTIALQHQGGWFDLGDGVALWVLWPPAAPFLATKASDEQVFDNENSLVMKLVYGDFSVLLTGDAGLPAENALLATGAPLTATVLKVGHHGSKGSSSAGFVEKVKPLVAVIQSGADNTYGHPHSETLERLASRLVLRNDRQGRLHLFSDGRQLWIEPAHAGN